MISSVINGTTASDKTEPAQIEAPTDGKSTQDEIAAMF